MVDSHLLSLLLLAVVQGVTEFLPISSSGHLALGEMLLGVGQEGVFEDVMLHLGTLGAVVAFYRGDLLRLLRGLYRPGEEGRRARHYVGCLVLGTVPAAVVGLLLRDSIEAVFGRAPVVLALLAVTGTMLWMTRRLPRRDEPLSARRALLIGCAQSLALLPGFSRSGWTIATGLALGLSPVEAARFGFLLSIPAILGAAVLQWGEGAGTGLDGPLLLAVAVSLAVGLACLKWLVHLVRNMALHRFAWYLWGLAAVGGLGLLLR